MITLRKALTAALLVVLVACQSVSPPADTPDNLPRLAASDNTAVVALLDTARSDIATGQNDKAGAAIERALRIEPRNAVLWYELAKLRLKEGQYQQAETLARKSSSLAGDHKELRAANWRLIAQTYIARGDSAAARSANQKADALLR